MIRRNATNADGSPCWVLIPQPEHAHLAGRLAEYWGTAGDEPLKPRMIVVAAVYRHDDGWRRWERRPGIEPSTGEPLTFTEMPLDEANEIWTHSIEGVSDLGPLAQFMVAQHFVDLRQHGGRAEQEDAIEFVHHYQERSRAWLASWQQVDPQSNTTAVAERAVAYLRLFDGLSLWFSCVEPTEPHTLETPDGTPLTLRPQGDRRMTLEPWPMCVPRVELTLAGQIVPKQRYDSAEALAAAPKADVTLAWELLPA